MLIITCALLAYKSTALPEPNPSPCAALPSLAAWKALKSKIQLHITVIYATILSVTTTLSRFATAREWRWALSLSGCPHPVSQAQTSTQCSLSHSFSPLLLQADVTASTLPQLSQNSVSLWWWQLMEAEFRTSRSWRGGRNGLIILYVLCTSALNPKQSCWSLRLIILIKLALADGI